MKKQPSGGMGFYRAFDVTVTDDGCSFDIAKDGRFDLYLVANADPTLEGAVKGPRCRIARDRAGGTARGAGPRRRQRLRHDHPPRC